MKLLFLIGFLFLFSSNQTENGEVESILYDCLIQRYQDEGVDVLKELDRLEDYLIEKEFLASSSGKAYHDFYKKVGETNRIPSQLDYKQFEGLYKIMPNDFYTKECLEQIEELDSTVVVNSKQYQMTTAMSELSGSDLGPGKVAKATISVLNPADFDSPYFRALALLTIAYTSDSDTGFSIEK